MHAWFLICASLLAVSGAAKLADPAPTGGALAAASLPSAAGWVRLLGATELAIAAVALGFGGTAGGVAVALAYTGFAGFAALALRRNLPVQSCGCFGRADTPPSVLHVVFDGAAAVSGAWVAVTAAGGLTDALAGQPLAGVPYLALVGTGVFAGYLVLAELPALSRLGARRA